MARPLGQDPVLGMLMILATGLVTNRTIPIHLPKTSAFISIAPLDQTMRRRAMSSCNFAMRFHFGTTTSCVQGPCFDPSLLRYSCFVETSGSA